MLIQGLFVATLAIVASAQQANLTATLAGLPQLQNLTTALSLFPDLVQQLSTARNVTLLAPSNAAFAKAMEDPMFSALLTSNDISSIQAFFSYHVLNGTYYASAVTSNITFLPTTLTKQTSNMTLLDPAVVEAIMVNDTVQFTSGLLSASTVTSANNNFTGGTIHIIDTVLTVPEIIPNTVVALNLTSAAGALQRANLNAGPLPANLTAFIPSNAAFASISNLISNLSMTEIAGLMGYHIVPNVTAFSTDIVSNTSLPTFIGQNISVALDSAGDIFVNQAKVITPNILILEGVMHVIDAVLNPMNAMMPPNASESGGVVAFPGASSMSMAPFTSGVSMPSSVPAAATGGAGGAAGSGMEGGGAATATSASGVGPAGPVATGAVGAAALFGGVVAVLNLYE